MHKLITSMVTNIVQGSTFAESKVLSGGVNLFLVEAFPSSSFIYESTYSTELLTFVFTTFAIYCM